MRLKLLSVILIVFGLLVHVKAQVGEWTNYQSYRSASKLIDTGEIIYCAGNGALFTYNKNDNSSQKLSSINGLSDVDVENLAYSPENDMVLIAYENSNIDLIFNKEIYNLSDIKRKQIMGNKAINNVIFKDQLAYLSCGFGIVVINIEKKEIKDTYYIAEGGTHLNINDITYDNTYLYAATDNGIYRALISEPNLQDYSNWQHIEDIPHVNSSFSQIENFNGKIIACYSPENEDDEIYKLNGNAWSRVFSEINKAHDIKAFDNRIIISNDGDVYTFDENGTVTDKIYQYIFPNSESVGIYPRSALQDKDGSYWIADNFYGLVHKAGSNCEQLSPDGPFDNKVFSLYVSGNDLWVAPGGRDASWSNLWNQPRFQKYSEGTWTVFDGSKYPEMAGFHDVICIVTDPQDPEHVFVGCWGAGIFEFRNNEFVERYSYHNSSLQTVLEDANYVAIGGMAFDNDGTLWVNNGGVPKPISSFKNGEWEAYSLPDISGTPNFGDIVITEDGDKWIALSNRNKDIYVIKGDNEDSKLQKNIAYFSNGTQEQKLEMHEVYCLTIDQDGAIWVGSSKGIAVYDDPSRIWISPEEDSYAQFARQPGLDLNDGIYHPLLASETVTAIAVDGGNRKWCGTRRNGIFLISENGEKELEHFTNENSPLLSNEITDIAINQQTGEVYIGTSEGLTSYMGVATEPEKTFTDVYVYPNPVRETYNGSIVVTGLVENTDVKITDISGNLVFHGKSIGGQAAWDGKNQNGNRCHTGVYLVFLNNKSGEETFVTKLLFIH